tara:strand:- start:3903 stop:4100 length:198 start_codon:yes stop_codon:yes gene_type:complete
MKQVYEIFNMSTGKWESKEMTELEYNKIQAKMDSQADVLEAEYEIITKIISQKLHPEREDVKSMD